MRLYVNIDHVATVRQARRTVEPDPVEAALACLAGGADGITVHLREDRRHIQDRDVHRLHETITSPLNLELATADDIVQLACTLRPMQVTFVPERREEVTTEGGLDLTSRGTTDGRLADAIQKTRAAGIRVSLFIDPDPASIERSASLEVDAVELHTGAYANAHPAAEAELERLREAAAAAKGAGLAVHAGHGLTYVNVGAVAAIPELEELNIGHSIVSRSILAGMEAAVREMGALVRPSR